MKIKKRYNSLLKNQSREEKMSKQSNQPKTLQDLVSKEMFTALVKRMDLVKSSMEFDELSNLLQLSPHLDPDQKRAALDHLSGKFPHWSGVEYKKRSDVHRAIAEGEADISDMGGY